MDTAQELADAVVHELFGADEIPSLAIPYVALAVVACPTLAGASQEECQYIFDKLVGAVASRQLARIVAKSARYVA